MKFTKSLILIGVLSLAACSSSTTKPMPTDKIVVSQAGDSQLSCDALQSKMGNVEQQTTDMVNINQERSKGQFLSGSAANVALALLSPASANNRFAQQNGFSLEEAARLESLQQRHNHLLNIAKDKNCLFAPKVESRLNSVKSDVKEQTFRQRNHN